MYVQIRDVPPGMNARYHATGRTYVYRISCPSSIHNISVFEFNRCWAYDGHLDSEAMAEAASQLLGTHDFSTFRATGAILAAFSVIQREPDLTSLLSCKTEMAASTPVCMKAGVR